MGRRAGVGDRAWRGVDRAGPEGRAWVWGGVQGGGGVPGRGLGAGAGVAAGSGDRRGLRSPLPSYWMRRAPGAASCLFWARCMRLRQSGVSAPVKRTGVTNSSRYGQRTWGQRRGLSRKRSRRGDSLGGAPPAGTARSGLPGRAVLPTWTRPHTGRGVVSHRAGPRPHTHVAHPVHRGADQVEGPDADGVHAVGRGLLAAGARRLRLLGKQSRVAPSAPLGPPRLQGRSWAQGPDSAARVEAGQTGEPGSLGSLPARGQPRAHALQYQMRAPSGSEHPAGASLGPDGRASCARLSRRDQKPQRCLGFEKQFLKHTLKMDQILFILNKTTLKA